MTSHLTDRIEGKKQHFLKNILYTLIFPLTIPRTKVEKIQPFYKKILSLYQGKKSGKLDAISKAFLYNSKFSSHYTKEKSRKNITLFQKIYCILDNCPLTIRTRERPKRRKRHKKDRRMNCDLF